MEDNEILDDFQAFKGFISGVFVYIEILKSKNFINCEPSESI